MKKKNKKQNKAKSQEFKTESLFAREMDLEKSSNILWFYLKNVLKPYDNYIAM